MKAALAVVVAVLFLVAGWGFLHVLLLGLYYVASNAREGIGLLHYLHMLSVLILCPLYGGFVAAYLTPRIFKEIDAAKIARRFIYVVVTLAVVGSLLGFLQPEKYYSSSGDIAEFVFAVLQIVAVIVGAIFGKSKFYDEYLEKKLAMDFKHLMEALEKSPEEDNKV